jgi:acetyl esterase/lipase
MRRSIRFGLIALLVLVALPAAAGTGYTATTDHVYGHKAGMALTLDVIKPVAGANGIGLINVVSGGWVSDYFEIDKAMADSEKSNGRLTTLIGKGYTIFVVRHGSSPYFKVPDAVADMRRAVRYIRHNAATFGVDPNKLGVYGGSAGGHLSLMLGTASDDGNEEAPDPIDRESCRVACVVAYYPPVDLRGLAGPSERFPALDFDPAKSESISPILFVTADDAPTLLIHGDEDDLVPISNSEKILAAFQGVTVPADFITIEGAGHGFRGEHGQRAAEALTAWFEKYLAGK